MHIKFYHINFFGGDDYIMRNLLVKLKYDGRDFCGWQVQDGLRTVQSVFQETLWDVLRERVPFADAAVPTAAYTQTNSV